jgi:hypothetical protein
MRRFFTASIAALALLLTVGGGNALSVGATSARCQATASGAQDDCRMGLFAQLRGTKEISPSGKRRAGDLDGRGSFAALIHKDQKFCFGITVTGIGTPIAAHIHKGKRGKNGPIVIPLTAPSTGDPGASSGCVDADASLLADIRKHPRRYYANVHTTDFPGGAVRGQLFQPKRNQDR